MGMKLDYEIGIPCFGTMEHVVVFRTHEVEWNIVKTRFENQEVPRGCQHGDHGRKFSTIWRRAHTKIVHAGVCGKGSAQNTQKMRSEQRDGRMDDERDFQLRNHALRLPFVLMFFPQKKKTVES